jgi:hypothetical protein
VVSALHPASEATASILPVTSSIRDGRELLWLRMTRNAFALFCVSTFARLQDVSTSPSISLSIAMTPLGSASSMSTMTEDTALGMTGEFFMPAASPKRTFSPGSVEA